jgi:hypothetical protein
LPGRGTAGLKESGPLFKRALEKRRGFREKWLSLANFGHALKSFSFWDPPCSTCVQVQGSPMWERWMSTTPMRSLNPCPF